MEEYHAQRTTAGLKMRVQGYPLTPHSSYGVGR